MSDRTPLTLSIPNAKLGLVVDALCEHGGYDPARDGAKPAFAKQVLIRFLQSVVQQYQARRSAEDVEVT